jgi:hypothetical protein
MIPAEAWVYLIPKDDSGAGEWKIVRIAHPNPPYRLLPPGIYALRVCFADLSSPRCLLDNVDANAKETPLTIVAKV